MVLHPKTEPLRELVRLYDAAPALTKFTYGRELIVQLVSLAADQAHAIDKLEARVKALEQFPETRS